jgi:hypothetical protein
MRVKEFGAIRDLKLFVGDVWESTFICHVCNIAIVEIFLNLLLGLLSKV